MADARAEVVIFPAVHLTADPGFIAVSGELEVDRAGAQHRDELAVLDQAALGQLME